MANLSHIFKVVDTLTEEEQLELLAHVALQLKTTRKSVSHPLTTTSEKLILPTFSGQGLQPGVRLDCMSQLLDLMDG